MSNTAARLDASAVHACVCVCANVRVLFVDEDDCVLPCGGGGAFYSGV